MKESIYAFSSIPSAKIVVDFMFMISIMTNNESKSKVNMHGRTKYQVQLDHAS